MHLRQLVSRVIQYSPSRIIPALVGILALPLYTRLLSAQEYGVYVIIMSTLLIASTISLSWITSMTLRIGVVVDKRILEKYLLKYLILSVCVASMIFSLYLEYINPKQPIEVFLVGITWIILNIRNEIRLTWWRIYDDKANYNLALALRSVLSVLVSLMLIIILDLGANGIILGSCIAMMAVPMLRLKEHKRTTDSKIDKAILFDYLKRYTIPSTLIAVATIGFSQGDRFIIQMLLGGPLVGKYSANYELAEKAIIFINSLFTLATSVEVFKKFDTKINTIAINYLEGILETYLIIVVPFAFAFIMYSENIAEGFFNRNFSDVAYIIKYIVFAGVITGIIHRYTIIFTAKNKIMTNAICALLAFIVNMVSCYAFVSEYGLSGAAYSTVLTAVVWYIIVRIALINEQTPRMTFTTVRRIIFSLVISYVVNKLYIAPLLNDIFQNQQLLTGLVGLVVLFTIQMVTFYSLARLKLSKVTNL